jgi:AraC-like DNA-binding protein
MRLKPRNLILGRFVCLETSDVSEVAEKISWTRPHRIALLSPRDAHLSRLSYAPLLESSLGYLATNVRIQDRLGATDSAFVVLIAVEGSGEHSMAGARFQLNRRRAAVHSPSQTAEVTTSGHFEALSISVKQSTIIGELEKCLGRKIGAPIEFAPSLDMASLAGTALWRSATRLCHLLDHTLGTPQKLLAVRQEERWLLAHLVESHRHNYTRLLNRTLLAGPWQVRAAEEFIDANAANPLSLGDIASIAGVNARTLQYSFRRHRGMSPMDFLRRTRLERVRNELLSPDVPTTVSQAAARWGLFHFGRFAAQYRKLYGETPSATLRRGKSLSD